MSQLTFDDALRIAKGCTDYGGGYRGTDHEIYQHGIQTVINALESAKEKGLCDPQTHILHAMGAERCGVHTFVTKDVCGCICE